MHTQDKTQLIFAEKSKETEVRGSRETSARQSTFIHPQRKTLHHIQQTEVTVLASFRPVSLLWVEQDSFSKGVMTKTWLCR